MQICFTHVSILDTTSRVISAVDGSIMSIQQAPKKRTNTKASTVTPAASTVAPSVTPPTITLSFPLPRTQPSSVVVQEILDDDDDVCEITSTSDGNDKGSNVQFVLHYYYTYNNRVSLKKMILPIITACSMMCSFSGCLRITVQNFVPKGVIRSILPNCD